MRRPLIGVLAAALWVAGPLPAQPAPADPEGAERQYRVARRLAAEASPQAAEALARVVELDPRGSLADDALIEQALLSGTARWPEELGRIDAAGAAVASGLLQRVLDELPASDRAPEARLLHSLLRLEPLPARDTAGARVALLQVATLEAKSPWSAPARYAIGWLDERQGNDARARDAWQRLVVDAPGTPAARRALVGLARLDLREERFGEAAARLQRAIDLEVADELHAAALRELAVRGVLRRRGLGGEWTRPALRTSPGIRVLTALAAEPGGGALLAERKGGRIVRLGADGRLAGEWLLEDVQGLAVDGLGRAFAAAGDRIYRLEPAGTVVQVAVQGDFAPVSALAADGLGRLWIVDRRGSRIGSIDAGSSNPRGVWSGDRVRVELVAWDGRRLLAADTRNGRLLAIGADGSEQVVAATLPADRPVALAADPSGRAALLDGRTGEVTLLDARGAILETWPSSERGVGRAVAVAVGSDGSLDVFDGSSGAWMRVP